MASKKLFQMLSPSRPEASGHGKYSREESLAIAVSRRWTMVDDRARAAYSCDAQTRAENEQLKKSLGDEDAGD